MENLLRSCRDSVSLSLLKVKIINCLFSFIMRGIQSAYSVIVSQFSHRVCRVRASLRASATVNEALTGSQRISCGPRKQPTHKDMYSPTRDVESERGQRGTLYRSEPYHEICCPHPTSKRPLTFHPVSPGDCITVEMNQERQCVRRSKAAARGPKW